MSVNYTEFPVVCTSDFEGVSFDCTLTDSGWYYLQLSYIKKYAEEETNSGAEGLIMATNIHARSLEEIDARCKVLFEAGLFDYLHIDNHGILFNETGDVIDDICWSHIGSPSASIEPIPSTVTIQ